MATRKRTKKTDGRRLVPVKLTDSARSVWLAGVGALAAAEDRGSRMVSDGEELFERLIKQGKAYEAKNRKRLADMLDSVKDARGDFGAKVGRLTGRVTDRVSVPLNDAVARALNTLGVPTRKEIATLTKRVEELTRAVERSQARRTKPEPEAAFVE
jgi:poly(hydroxyalkanoate) granule-associated protein